MTLILRIKFTGCEDINYVMGFCDDMTDENHSKIYGKNKLTCRINEEEGALFLKPNRAGNCKPAKSSEYYKFYEDDPSVTHDMLSFTIRCTEKFRTLLSESDNIRNLSQFPFDQNLTNFRFELSHFELTLPSTGKKYCYRFDFYSTCDEAVSWKS